MTTKNINVNKYPKTKKYISLYFHAHQPFRISNFSVFDIGTNKEFFEGPFDQTNEFILNRVANIGYNEANNMFLDLIKTSGLKVSYSITGTLLEQFQMFRPECIDIFRSMVDTGKVELVAETYYHSLAFFHSMNEFVRQVKKHRDILQSLFGYSAKVFRNTELTYRNDVGEAVRRLGFKGVYAEGWDPILDWRTPNHIYNAKKVNFDEKTKQLLKKNKVDTVPRDIRLLLKNYRRSDDVAFRFQLKGWEGYPVTADKFAQWIKEEPGYLINLCMDYETIGEHHRADSGIFEFYRHLPDELAKVGVEFILPSEAIELYKPEDIVDFPYIVSWADHERDLSAWTGNSMQKNSLESIYKIEPKVYEVLETVDERKKNEMLHVWGKLQTSDHFYYMSTKYWSDGDVHKYFSPYNSPYEAFIYFTNALHDFKVRYLGL